MESLYIIFLILGKVLIEKTSKLFIYGKIKKNKTRKIGKEQRLTNLIRKKREIEEDIHE